MIEKGVGKMWETVLGIASVLIFFTVIILFFRRHPQRSQPKTHLHETKRHPSFYTYTDWSDGGDGGDSGD